MDELPAYENADRSDQKGKNILADTSAMILFSTPVSMSIDIVAANATLQQAVIARLIALPVNMISSRPYGVFRDACFDALKFNAETAVWKRTVVDSLTMTLFQGSLYAGILASSGFVSGKPFSMSSIGIAVATAIPVTLVTGRPYGWFRNKIRQRVFGLETRD